MYNEYLRACLSTKKSHYSMKGSQQMNCAPFEMKTRKGGVQLMATLQSIPIFPQPSHPSLVLYGCSPSFQSQPFIIDQQTGLMCLKCSVFQFFLRSLKHPFAHFSVLIIIWVYSSENVQGFHAALM